MPATIDGPAGMPVIAAWTGGDADLLRDSLRMTNESFAAHLGVAVRTVANWRKQPEIIPKQLMQEALDTALERAPDRAKAQFALMRERGRPADRVDSPGIRDPHASGPAGSSSSAAQAIPRQRIPPDDIDDLLAQLTVTGSGYRRCARRPHAACALFGCGPASASWYPYGGRPPR